MADIDRKLALLAERGTRVGAEELIERIEAELALDPLVVVSKQRKGDNMTKTREKLGETANRRSRGWVWGVAAFASVMLFAGLAFILLTNAEPTDVAGDPTVDPAVQQDVELIQSWFTAWFSGDFETAADLIGEFPRDDHPTESVHQSAIGAEATVESCFSGPDDPRLYTCKVSYTNALFEAVGEQPYEADMEIRVINDGLLRPFPYIDMGQNPMVGRWLTFEREMGYDVESSCSVYAPPSTCSTFMFEHLDEFRDWYAGRFD